MNFQFKTEVIGVMMDVTGTFVAAEPHLNLAGAFDIISISHKGDEIDFMALPDRILMHVSSEALKESSKAAMGL